MVVGRSYLLMESYCADWWAANGKIVDVPAVVEVQSVDMPEIDHLEILLEKDADWTEDFVSVDSLVAEIWGQYRGDHNFFELSVTCTAFEVVDIGHELFLSNIALVTRLEKTETRERDALADCEAAGAKFVKACNNAGVVVNLQKRHTGSDVSVHDLTVELARVKAQLVQLTAEKVEFCTGLGAVAA